MSAPAAVYNGIPFLGLHYFDEEHEHLFFGREEQLRDLLSKLKDSKFVTVIGSSGTGKSSLARAGLIPALRAGIFVAAGHQWRIAKTRPESSPIHNLAQSLENVFKTEGVETTLRRGPRGLIEAARQCGITANDNLLIMVDQFEEIFRYQREAANRQVAAEESASFVKLLLEATAKTQQLQPAIFVLITMRSDYLGACAQFRDLPERINKGLYLIPRMRRDQLEEAITGPAAVAGARFSPPLVQKLLNDAGEDPDQLPVLQHALLRAWLNWKEDPKQPKEIDFVHYDATGGVRDGLDNHAEEIFNGLSVGDQKIAEVLFRSLTERDPSNNDIRRPCLVREVADVSGAGTDEVRRVADAFRGQGVSFLTPTAPTELDENTLLDITHESLIRKWYRLRGTLERKGWVQDEAELREQYRDLVKCARRELPKGEVLIGGNLEAALEWRKRGLNSSWGLRYDPASDTFGMVSEHIERSEKFRQREKTRRRRNLILKGIAVLLLLVLAGIYRAHNEKQKDEDALKNAKAEGKADALSQQNDELQRQIHRSKALEAEATESGETARRAEADAKGFQRVATARQLASQADGLKDRNSRVDVSGLIAIESLKQHPLPEGIQALRNPMALLRRPLWTKLPAQSKSADENDDEDVAIDPTSWPRLQFSSDSRYLARVSDDARLHVYRVESGVEVMTAFTSQKADSLVWDGTQLYLLVGDRDKESVTAVVYAISLTGAAPKEVLRHQCTGICLLTPDGKYLMATDSPTMGSGGQLLSLYGGPPLLIEKGGRPLRVGSAQFLLRESQNPQDMRQSLLSITDMEKQTAIQIEGSSPLRPFAFGNKGTYLAVVNENRLVRIYKTQPKFEPVGQVALPQDPATIALSSNAHWIAIADREGGVSVVDWGAQARHRVWSQSNVVEIAFSPDDQFAASVSASGELRVLPLRDDQRAVAPNGNNHASGAFGEPIPLQLNPLVRRISIASFDASQRFLSIRFPNFALLFDAATGVQVPFGGGTDPSAIIVSEDGRYAAASYWTYRGNSSSPRLVDLKVNSTKVLPLQGEIISLSPGARYLVLRDINKVDQTGRPNGSYHIVDSSGQSVSDLRGDVRSVKFSPDGRLLFVQDSSSAALLSCDTWQVARKWKFPWQRVTPLFSHGFLLLRGMVPISNSDKQPAQSHLLVETEPPTDKKLALPEAASIKVAQFSPNGRALAVTTQDDSVMVFELPSGRLLSKIKPEFVASLIEFSHSSNYLGLAAVNAAPSVFRLTDGAEVSRAGLEEKERLLAFHFSEDDRAVVMVSTLPMSGQASTDRPPEVIIRRQSLFANDLIREGCARLSRNLTLDEWKHYLPDYPYERTCPELPPGKQ